MKKNNKITQKIIEKIVFENPNDYTLGAEIRKLINQTKEENHGIKKT